MAMAVAATIASMNSQAATDINVNGKITPPACTATVSGGSNLDWGSIAHTQLSATDFTTLPAKQAIISVSCPTGTTTSVALWMVDPNQSSAMAGKDSNGRTGHGWTDRGFGLGLDPITQKPIGNFTMNPTQTSVDGTVNSSKFGYVTDSGHTATSFGVTSMASWAYKKTEDWTAVDSTGKPATGQNFTWTFDVEPQLNKSSNISNSVEVPFSGTAQVNVRYF